MPSYNISQGAGITQVYVQACFLGSDLTVIITAGKAHVGAIALAVPCAHNAEGVLASCSVVTAPGHRDNIPAETAALKLCKALHCNVSVTAGLHIDQASKEEIMTLVDNSTKAVDILISKIKEG